MPQAEGSSKLQSLRLVTWVGIHFPFYSATLVLVVDLGRDRSRTR